MSSSCRKRLHAGVLLAFMLVKPSFVLAVGVPQDACQVFTPADYKALGISAAPKGRVADSPAQSMRSCSAGSRTAPPMLSIMIQDIKMPVAVDAGRKSLASSAGENLAGAWDAGKVMTGVDGIQVHFFKGNVSVLVMSSATDATARNTLIAIAKRVAAVL